MAKILLAEILNGATNEKLSIASGDVFDVASNRTLASIIGEILAKLEDNSAADGAQEIADLKSELEEMQTLVNNFLTGEADDNGAIDRLKELVAAIEANKSSLEALTDKASQEDFDALAEQVAALEGKNWSVLDGIGKDEATGNLTFNGHELNGETGIAFGDSADNATSFTGKIKIVLQEIEVGDTD